MANRLADATSPYLLQHQDNPVEWHPWGDEAFAEARRRDVPILLSVGYAACHWCHVMAHESFEDESTAAQMNESFVNVKVDREERPDVDAVYMDAVTAMTGHGGWPMTVFLSPDGRPFFAGTYFPPRRTHGLPAFSEVLRAVAQTWSTRRAEVDRQASEVLSRLGQLDAAHDLGADAPPTDDDLRTALQTLMRQYDHVRGGFGDAPKFPPSMVLEFLLRHHARTGDADALLMAEGTMRAMASGGMYDQLAGGFARYSVDARWVVPHFEKMLYDNALLARVYLHLWRVTGRELGRRVAEETADFMVRELRTAEGGFASALDADSEGVEGRFYVWTPQELQDVLGAEDGAWAADVFGVTDDGTFEHGWSTLQRRSEPDDDQRLSRLRATLLEAREGRPRPQRDGKVVAAWNGLAIAALAECGAVLDRPDLVDAARTAASLVLDVHVVDGVLRRVSRDGRVGQPSAVLEDHGDLAEGLLALFSVTGESRWLDAAVHLLERVLAEFADGNGGFYDTAHAAEQLVRRPRDPTDNAAPSGWSATAGSLLTASAYLGSTRLGEAAEAALARVRRLVASAPRFAGWSAAVAEASLAGPVEVAIVGRDGELRHALHATALLATSPGAAVAVGAEGSSVPLLEGRPAGPAGAAAYVCRNFACQAPTSDPAELAGQVGARVRSEPNEGDVTA